MKLHKIVEAANIFHDMAIYSFKKISQTSYTMPDDEDYDDEENSFESTDSGKYNDITAMAIKYADNELLLIAELYKKSLELKAGFNFVNKAIANYINLNLEDEENESQQNIENLLNEVVRDIRTRAGNQVALNKADSPVVIEQLKQIKNQFNYNTLKEDLKEIKVPEDKEISQYDEKAVSTFDPYAGALEGQSSGYGFQSVKELKDWTAAYNNEIDRYQGILLSTEDPDIKNKIITLINVLDVLKDKTANHFKLINEYLITSSQNLEEKINISKNELDSLRKEKNSIKLSIRNFELKKDISKLKNIIPENEKEKLLLEQKIKLKELTLSKDQNKKEETDLRKLLIKLISSNNEIKTNELNKMLQKIEEAKSKKIPIKKLRKDEVAKIQEHFEKIETNKRKRGKPITFEGLIINLKERIATQKTVIKQSIKDKMIKERHVMFQPYYIKITEIIKSGNEEELKKAEKELNKAANKYAETQPIVMSYVTDSEKMYAFRDMLIQLSKYSILETSDEIPENIENEIKAVIDFGKLLISELSGKKYYDKVIESISNANESLKRRIDYE